MIKCVLSRCLKCYLVTILNNHGQKTTAMTSYSALTHTRHHTRRVPGVPGSAKRWCFKRGCEVVVLWTGLSPRVSSEPGGAPAPLALKELHGCAPRSVVVRSAVEQKRSRYPPIRWGHTKQKGLARASQSGSLVFHSRALQGRRRASAARGSSKAVPGQHALWYS